MALEARTGVQQGQVPSEGLFIVSGSELGQVSEVSWPASPCDHRGDEAAVAFLSVNHHSQSDQACLFFQPLLFCILFPLGLVIL